MTPERCNACSAALRRGFEGAIDPYTREQFSVLFCSACGLGHTAPQPDDLDPYYGPAYYGERHGFTDAYNTLRRRRILERASPRPGRLLDVGCGEAHFLAAAKGRGWEVAGTEREGPAVDRARRAGIEVCGSLDQAAARGPFDCVTLWHSLEHLRDPRSTMETVRDLLRPNGKLIVAVPDAGGLQARVFRRRWFHLDVPRHLYHFSRRALESLLEGAGFRPDREIHLEIEHDLFGWIQSALNVVLPDPNVLFGELTGRSTGKRTQVAASFLLGTVMAPASFAGTILGTASARGATLIAISSLAGPPPRNRRR